MLTTWKQTNDEQSTSATTVAPATPPPSGERGTRNEALDSTKQHERHTDKSRRWAENGREMGTMVHSLETRKFFFHMFFNFIDTDYLKTETRQRQTKNPPECGFFVRSATSTDHSPRFTQPLPPCAGGQHATRMPQNTMRWHERQQKGGGMGLCAHSLRICTFFIISF